MLLPSEERTGDVQGGDIDNGFQPCLLVVFEGLLGLPPEQEARKRR
jgi:hypothetical protein